MKTRTRTICKAGLLALALSAGSASAAQIYWTDWTGVDLDSGNGFRGVGTITTSNATVTVTYTNPQGIAFYQTSGGNDYYRNGTDGPGGTSPASQRFRSATPWPRSAEIMKVAAKSRAATINVSAR